MKYAFFILTALTVCCTMTTVSAQTAEDFHAIGNGIDVDSQGVVLPLALEKSEALGKMMADILESLPENLDKTVPLRKISLKKLDAQVKKIVDQYEVLPDTIRYLGGLTSIDYIVAVPEENDLLLIGNAEGWKADAAGNIIGKASGKPVLVFEDLLSILRAMKRTIPSNGISCSIDQTPETQAKLVRLHQQYTNLNAQNADAYSAAFEEAYGNCPIVINGVSASSRFARILVAADFKMKRIALGLEPSQTRNMPSYVSLLSSSRLNISPQFWLTPEYTGIVHDSRKLTWRLGDVKVRVSSRATDGTDRAALTWCRSMEDNFDALAKVQPVFGELRNAMKLTLASAIIHQENLLQKANCSLTILLNDSALKLIEYPQPKSVRYQSVKSRTGFSTIVACGGVEINPATSLRNKTSLDNKIDTEREKLIQTSGNEWWTQ